MAGKSVTREELMEAVRQQLGLSRVESAELVQQVLEKICATLAAGETVKLSGFGTFTVREKGQRVGRNPTTGVEVSKKETSFGVEPNGVPFWRLDTRRSLVRV
ncbi:integration host factor subunit alpha [Microvirga sp. KLBC 81]|nr:integration host factor subunit alpha [Microvirga sp. KLBC 81]